MTTHTGQSALESRYEDLVKRQRAYFQTGATLTEEFRIAQLEKLRRLLHEHEEELYQAIYDDFGKSRYETQLTETLPLFEELELAIKKLPKWMARRRVHTNMMNLPAKSFIIPEPLGVSLVIGAWNFPYNLSLTPVVGSMMAGNTTILKPSELPPRTSALMARIINSHFAPEYLHVVEGAIPETTALLKQRYDKIFFTGSPTVGKIVNTAAAPHLTNVTLELGGKNPAVFMDDCDLQVSVKRMIWAKFVNSGQFCIAPDYVLVHRDIKERFLELAKHEIKQHNYSLENHNFVRIINERNFDRVVSLIDPEKVYHGGEHSRAERLIRPTIVQDVSLDDPIMQEEIFGPILPVIEFAELDEAFQVVKSLEKPLAAYFFSNNHRAKERFLAEIPFGSGGINDAVMQIANINLPFGGVGNSGMGRYHGEFSFECFSHFKGVIDKPTLFESNLKYYGYNERNMSLIRKLL